MPKILCILNFMHAEFRHIGKNGNAHIMLTQDQIDFFHETGYLVVPDAVTAAELAAIKEDFAVWVDESRSYSQSYGEMINGKPRFDTETGHNADKPLLRRVNAPHEISPAFFNVMSNSRMTDMVADLIGPDVKLHHSKINSKLPGAATAVKWHQDFPFTPHSNDSLVTALLMMDDVDEENGPLEVCPATHRGPLHSLWHDGTFTGAVANNVTEDARRNHVTCLGKAGSVCLMHTRLLHGSAPNTSANPRTLFICVYSAVDAIPLSPSPVPCEYQGHIVRGRDNGVVRTSAFALEMPALPKGASFFDQQSGQSTQ